MNFLINCSYTFCTNSNDENCNNNVKSNKTIYINGRKYNNIRNVKHTKHNVKYNNANINSRTGNNRHNISNNFIRNSSKLNIQNRIKFDNKNTNNSKVQNINNKFNIQDQMNFDTKDIKINESIYNKKPINNDKEIINSKIKEINNEKAQFYKSNSRKSNYDKFNMTSMDQLSPISSIESQKIAGDIQRAERVRARIMKEKKEN